MTVTARFTPRIDADIARATTMFINGEWVTAASGETLEEYLETKTVVVAL